MSRTHPTTLIALGLVGLVVGYLLELAAAAAGHAVFVPPLSLPFALVVIAVLVVLLAIPIRRAVTGKSTEHINPFRAMRVAALAKASALAGGVLLGAAIGILFYLLSRSVIPGGPTVWLAVASLVGAAVLLVAGLIAEHFCTLPPPDDNDEMKEARA